MPSNSRPFVSLTAEDYPPKLPLSGSVPIRAPLTIDDSDSEFDVSINGSVSDSGFESEGFLGGGDFETTSASPFVADVEADSASDVDKGGFEVHECTLFGEHSPMHHASLRVTPFAQLSTYDDDYEEESGVEVDNEVLSVVRVPSIDVPDSFIGAPRIKVLDDQDENVETLMSMDSLPVRVSQSLLANEFAFFNDMDSEDNYIEAENGTGSIGKVLVDSEAYDECSIATDTDFMLQYSQDNSSNEQPGMVKVVVVNELRKEGMKPYGIESSKGIATRKLIETDSRMQVKSEVDTRESIDTVDGTSIMVGGRDTSLSKSNVEDNKDNRMPSRNTSNNDLGNQNSLLTDFSMSGEPVSDVYEESDCEKLASTTQSTINSNAKLHDAYASFESFDEGCEGNKTLDTTPLLETTYLENDLTETGLGVSRESELLSNYQVHENVEKLLKVVDIVKNEATVDLKTVSQDSEKDASASDLSLVDAEGLISVGLEQFMEQISALSVLLDSKGFGKNSQEEQTVRSSHDKMDIPRDDSRRKLIYFAGVDKSDGSRVTITSADETSVVFLKDPASLSSLLHFETQAGFNHSVSEKEKEKIQKIQGISVKFLRLVLRLNISFEDSLVSRVLCRLVADIEMRSNQEFVIKSAKVSAKRLEEDCQEDLDLSLNILVLGKSGVGKSATINSIFGDVKVKTSAFEPATTSVKEVSGTIDGIKIRILDTPGLRSPMMEQAFNRKILSSIKRYAKIFPLDIVLFVDRLDSQTRDMNDLPILRSITSSLSPSIWQRAILTLTHAASAPLDGPSGSPLSYEVFVAQKCYLFQQSISQAVGNLCQLNPSFMCPVSLVENQPLHGKNISGECMLPNALRWRSHLLGLCFSLKILSEVSSMSGTQTRFDHWKHFFFPSHSQPLDHLLSSLLQSPAHLKFSADWN